MQHYLLFQITLLDYVGYRLAFRRGGVARRQISAADVADGDADDDDDDVSEESTAGDNEIDDDGDDTSEDSYDDAANSEGGQASNDGKLKFNLSVSIPIQQFLQHSNWLPYFSMCQSICAEKNSNVHSYPR